MGIMRGKMMTMNVSDMTDKISNENYDKVPLWLQRRDLQ
jgi:hypothetical protein